MIFYADSSAIVDMLVSPSEPLPWTATDEVCSSELVSVETRRALLRLRSDRALSESKLATVLRELMRFERGMRFADISTPVLSLASGAFPVYVRTLDAIHLATAVRFRARFPDLAFATHDRRLAVAAATVGFDVAGITL